MKNGRSIRRVALITSSFAPHVGGVETHVGRTARELLESGHEVEVWTVDRGDRGHPAVGPAVRYLPAPLPASSPGAIFGFARRGPRAWRSWVDVHRRFAPDVLHVHCFGPNGLYALGLAHRFRTPMMVTSHGETRADDGGTFAVSAQLRAGLRSALRRAAIVTAPSEFVLQDLRSSYGLVGGVVVPNGVDIDIEGRLSPIEQDFGTRYFLSVGRLGWMKGFDLLLRAFAAADLDHDVSLVIAGDGPERDALGALANSLGVGDRVTFPGWLNAAEVGEAMANAVAVVVPSRVEAFGIVILEAWREGAPVITTSHGGAPEFVTDEDNGLVVDPIDTATLARALERLSNDAELRSRLAAAGSARYPQFTWPRVAALYAEMYRTLPAHR